MGELFLAEAHAALNEIEDASRRLRSIKEQFEVLPSNNAMKGDIRLALTGVSVAVDTTMIEQEALANAKHAQEELRNSCGDDAAKAKLQIFKRRSHALWSNSERLKTQSPERYAKVISWLSAL